MLNLLPAFFFAKLLQTTGQIEKDYKGISDKTLSKPENIKRSDEEKLALIQSMIDRKRKAYFSLNNNPDDFRLNNSPPDDGWDDDATNEIFNAW